MAGFKGWMALGSPVGILVGTLATTEVGSARRALHMEKMDGKVVGVGNSIEVD
jgi:hypothetical protein